MIEQQQVPGPPWFGCGELLPEDLRLVPLKEILVAYGCVAVRPVEAARSAVMAGCPAIGREHRLGWNVYYTTTPHFLAWRRWYEDQKSRRRAEGRVKMAQRRARESAAGIDDLRPRKTPEQKKCELRPMERERPSPVDRAMLEWYREMREDIVVTRMDSRFIHCAVL